MVKMYYFLLILYMYLMARYLRFNCLPQHIIWEYTAEGFLLFKSLFEESFYSVDNAAWKMTSFFFKAYKAIS